MSDDIAELKDALEAALESEAILVEDNNKLRDELVEARTLLKKYGDHTENCGSKSVAWRCDCAWDEYE